MTEVQDRPHRTWSRARIAALMIVIAMAVLFIAANVHLVTVSIASQPACVPHPDHNEEGAALMRAAKSSC